jgi:hypothetical protein
MNGRFDHELSHALAQRVEAVRAVPEPDVVAAQRTLQARLTHGLAPARRASVRWLGAALTAAAALVILLALPFLPQSEPAFAAVQRHFLQFRTLSMRIEQTVGGQPLQQTHVLLAADGRMRVDVGEQLSMVLDPPRGVLVMLLHGARQARSMPVVAVPAAAAAPLDFLHEIRAFQGEARRLPRTRVIGGRQAQGWELALPATTLTLWADAQGLPLAMEQANGGVHLDFRFEFDVEPKPRQLEATLPPGYTWAKPDE